MQKTIVVIPARKGSSRLKNKNIKLLNGKPLIAHTIETAISLFQKDQVWVNSDCERVRDIAMSYGLNFYHRSASLGTDHTTTVEVLVDQLMSSAELPKTLVLLQPTSPFRSLKYLAEMLSEFDKSSRLSMATFGKLSLKFGKRTSGNYFTPVNYTPGQRSQDLEGSYIYESGSVYIIDVEELLLTKRIVTDDVIPFIISEEKECIDIDTVDDFRYAEFLIRKDEK